MEPEPTKQQLDLADQSMNLCLYYVAFVSFVDPPNQPGRRVHASATCSFVDTGARRFAITNHHVVQGYRDKKIHFPALNFHIGSAMIDIENRIISEDKFHDLVTFTITDEEIARIGKRFCYCREWPPQQAINGEVVFFAGYPGAFREQKGENKVEYQSILMTEMVTSSSPSQFTIVFDKKAWIKLNGPREFSELKTFGGLSGTAVFRLDEKNAIKTLEPIGIIYEGGDIYNIQLVQHIDFIDKEGLISKDGA